LERDKRDSSAGSGQVYKGWVLMVLGLFLRATFVGAVVKASYIAEVTEWFWIRLKKKTLNAES
jgi:hypothetical protein